MPDDPQPDLAALVDRVERILLGGTREYSRADVAARAGLPADETRELWRALGFANVADDEAAFTTGDVAALQQMRDLSESMSLDPALVRAMTRMLGRSFSRLASWQGQLVVEQLAARPELVGSTDGLVDFINRTLQAMQDLQSYVWRRQLAAYLSRVTASPSGEVATTMAVGFADMTEFTAFTRSSSEGELRGVLDAFEQAATDVIAVHGGQIVKTIGDEVLFVADRARDAAEIALGLLDVAAGSDVLPQLRAGVACGPVISRLGDVFGQPVNIASRLTSLARPGSALVDEGMQQALAADPDYALRPLRPVSVRGYHHLRAWRLRRAD